MLKKLILQSNVMFIWISSVTQTQTEFNTLFFKRMVD